MQGTYEYRVYFHRLLKEKVAVNVRYVPTYRAPYSNLRTHLEMII